MDDVIHDRALAAGQLRYCQICDGDEVTDKRVAVLGTGERGCDEALFLRSYIRDVTLASPVASHDLNAEQRDMLRISGP